MRKIVVALVTTVTGLLLLLGYRTSLGEPILAADATTSDAAAASGTGSSSTSTGPAAADATSGSAPASGSGGTTASSSGSTYADGTFLGDAASTRYGDVQVQVTVSGGVVTAVSVPVHPDANGRDQQINARAIPQLVSSTLAAQSASIDMVSGATFTSRGYVQSLQSALDAARA